MKEFGSIRRVKQTLSSSLDSDLPDVTSLNLLDQQSAPNDKTYTPVSPNGPKRKIHAQSLKNRVTAVPAERNTVRMERDGTPLGFPDSVYFHAAAIFQKTHVEKDLAHRLIRYGRKSPSCKNDDKDKEEEEEDGGDDNEEDCGGGGDDDDWIVDGSDANAKQNEHWAYELAFNTLKYQDLLEAILIDSYFYRSQQMPDDLMALVMVVLYALLDRKFQPRKTMKIVEEGLIKEVRQVEDSLFRFKTNLEASLAQYRIKHNLLTIDSFLPPAVRDKQQRSLTLPIYAWVNTLKISIDTLCESLRTAGFTQVDSHTHLMGNVFCKDEHCSNVLLFPRWLAKQLEKTKLLTERKLIIQDKSRSLAACAVRPLLVEGADILMVGSFSAMTVAHMAVQAAAYSGGVHVCGVLNILTFTKELQSILPSSICKSVKLIPEYFNELNEWDSNIQKVRVILLLPKCSVSALCNPVEFILNESGDRGLLHGLSKGTISDSKLETLVAKQRQDLSHALSFPKVKAVVYCTCSLNPEENEQLVKRALENTDSKAKALPFRLVSAGWGDQKEKFFQTEPSDVTNGCFLCVMKREQDPAEVETVQDILARAAAKGLLGGLMPPDPLIRDIRKKRKKQTPVLPPSTQTEPPASAMINSNPQEPIPQTPANPKLNATFSTQDHTSSSKGQISLTEPTSDTTNKPKLLDQSFNAKIPPKKHSKHHKPRNKVPKQSKRRKASKSRNRKERRSRSQAPRRRLLHLRPSQNNPVTSIKPAPPPSVRTPASANRSRRLLSRAASQQESVKPKVIMKAVDVQPREFSLPPIYPLSSSRLSSSSSNSSSSLSSSSSTQKPQPFTFTGVALRYKPLNL